MAKKIGYLMFCHFEYVDDDNMIQSVSNTFKSDESPAATDDWFEQFVAFIAQVFEVTADDILVKNLNVLATYEYDHDENVG